jgi:hypothetical protein
MRKANAIDFWRGAALLNIFLSHIPGNVFERLSYRNFSLSDSSEAFIFLAGCAFGLGKLGRGTNGILGIVTNTASRMTFLYKTQLLMTAAAIAILWLGATLLNDPAVLQMGRAGALVADPARSAIGLLLMVHQLQYFDILPLYIVLTALAPLILILNARSPWLLLTVSVAVWAAAILLQLNLGTWPMPGQWFFNPLAWQMLFVFGFILVRGNAPALTAQFIGRQAFWLAFAIVIAADALVAMKATPDSTIVDFTSSSILFNKSFLGPARVIHFLAVLVVFYRVYPMIESITPLVTRSFALFGRTSLQVFVAASLLSLVARILKHTYGRDLAIDLVVVVVGLVVLTLTAWWTERRKAYGKRSVSSVTFAAVPSLSLSR